MSKQQIVLRVRKTRDISSAEVRQPCLVNRVSACCLRDWQLYGQQVTVGIFIGITEVVALC